MNLFTRVIRWYTTAGVIALLAACQGASTSLPTLGMPRDLRPAASALTLYVVNGDGTIPEYTVGSRQILRTVASDYDNGNLAVDQAGNLYVPTQNAVIVYAHGTTSVLRQISVVGARDLAFDSAGDLYVIAVSMNNAAVMVYAPGSDKLLRKYTNGLNDPRLLAIDKTGRLYVANSVFSKGKITVYGANSSRLIRAVTNGIDGPNALAVDSYENLYVANVGNNTVSVYSPGGKALQRKITDGIEDPVDLKVDSKDNTYVANSSSKCVTVYVYGSSKVLHSITKGMRRPVYLAVDEKDYLYVYSGEVGVGEFKPDSDLPFAIVPRNHGLTHPYALVVGR